MILPDTVKEYFYTLRSLKAYTRVLSRNSQRKLEALHYTGSMCRALGGSLRDCSVQEEKLISLVDSHMKLREMQDLYNTREQEALELLQHLPDERLRFIMAERYLVGGTWEDIADRLFFSTRQVFRLHGKALSLLQEPYSKLLARERGGEKA